MKLFTHGYFPWDLNGGADYHAWVKEWGMWLIVAELKLFKKHPSITQHTVTIHHRFKTACKFKFAHQKKNKTHLQWFKVLTLDRFADSNLSERLCLHFCSAAKWDILKATGWWVECVWMSVHIHLRHQPCPHSVTIAAAKPFRLQQAAICPEEKSPPGQRYGPAVWRVLFPSLTFLQTSTNVSTASAPDVSGSNTCPLVANHLIQSALIKPPLCCVFSPKASRGVFLFLEKLVVSLSHSKLINYMKITVFNLTVKTTTVTKNTVHSNYSFI